MSSLKGYVCVLLVTTFLPRNVLACTCTNTEKPVCGVDGKSCIHIQVWMYGVYFQKKYLDVDVAYEGPCKKSRKLKGKSYSLVSSTSSEEGICACELIWMPVCGRNGVDYDNKCLAQCAGTKVAYPGKCRLDSTGISFWSTSGRLLPPRPRTCDECHNDFYPVCAEDNKTYRNRCFAECKMLKVISDGVCYGIELDTIPAKKLFTLPPPCRSGDTWPECIGPKSTSGSTGRLLPPPPRDCDRCSQEYDPVCGTDGKTYMNTCLCRCNLFVGVAYKGICHETGVDPRMIGLKPRKNCACPKSYIPVCGYDRVTYANACTAKCAGTGVFYAGKCNPILY